jgi:hypothetical protein
MLSEIIVEIVLRPIFELVFRPVLRLVAEIAGFQTGRLVVWMLSCGSIYVARMRKGAHYVVPRWHAVSRDSKSKRFVDSEMGALIGFVSWGIFVLCVFLVWIFRQ